MNELVKKALDCIAQALEQAGESKEVAEDGAWNIIFTRTAHLHQKEWGFGN